MKELTDWIKKEKQNSINLYKNGDHLSAGAIVVWDLMLEKLEEYAQQFKDGPQWIKASERLPEVFHIPISNKSIDKGSNRVPFRYDGELFAGRYIEEKWSIKDVFVTAEMDTVIQRKDFDRIFWLDESGQRTPADEENDPFIQKHLKIIMGKTLDIMIITHIERMWGGLEMASVQHFVETGKVNGSLYLRIKELAMGFAERWHNTAKSTPADDAVELLKALKQMMIEQELLIKEGILKDHTEGFKLATKLFKGE